MSRKSFWRRQSKSIQRGEEHDFLYREGVRDAGMNILSRTQSLPSVGNALLNVTGLGHVWATTGNLDTALERSKSAPSSCIGIRSRRITFLSTVRVVLIPPRNEYRDNDMTKELWWEESDYSAFKNSAIRELKALMTLKHLNSKAAQQVLYQPGFHLELDLELDTNSHSGKLPTNDSTSSSSSADGDEPCSMDSPTVSADARTKAIGESASRSSSIRPLGKSASTPNLESSSSSSHASTPTPSAPTRGGGGVAQPPSSSTSGADMGLISARSDVDLNKMHPTQHPSLLPPPTSPSRQKDKDRSFHPLALIVE